MNLLSEYDVKHLVNFVGEKKLKQLGLLQCHTCINIPHESMTTVCVSDTLNEITYAVSSDSYFHTATATLYAPSQAFLESACQKENILTCPECGKQYEQIQGIYYEPLPVLLSAVESDALKGILIDILL
ncbi:MAG: hypothetical protein AB9856_10565 [Cellulosilyticaceae bacterium]